MLDGVVEKPSSTTVVLENCPEFGIFYFSLPNAAVVVKEEEANEERDDRDLKDEV